jgi:Xaa-Pro aminopeptidase
VESLLVDYPAHRRQQLIQFLFTKGLDALLVSNPVSVTYLTGFSGESSYLVLGRERSILVSDSRFAQQIQEECPGLETVIRPTAQNLYQATAAVLTNLGLGSVGFESGHLTVAEWETLRELAPSVSWMAVRDPVENLRAIKDPSEIAQIREAISIAERAFAAFRAMIRPEESEKDLCDSLEMYIRRFGGKCASFPSIVAVGERAALPHAPPTGRKVAETELLLVDWGASGRFYKSDLTRILVTRKNSASSEPQQYSGQGTKLDTVYQVVLQAQEQALRLLRPGVKAQDVDAEARRVITEAGFGDFFGHGLGHGLGLEVHEAPSLRPNSNTVLQAGMVVTVEPGIYLPGWGGVRIEDDVLITPEGCEVLTSVPRDLQASICSI